eukprot:3503517-Ditylum_brightwellii.AAC.1
MHLIVLLDQLNYDILLPKDLAVGKTQQSKTGVAKTGKCIWRSHSSDIRANTGITTATKNKKANAPVSINTQQEGKVNG